MTDRLTQARRAGRDQTQWRAAAVAGARPTVLLTGFDPFDGAALNPSWLIAQALQGRQIAGHRVRALCLPTQFGSSLKVLRQALLADPPALCVCLGQAGGRPALSLERIAINVNDARIADNAGQQPVDTPVIAGGPAAYFTRLPIKAMREAIAAEGIAAEISQTAGTFVCNHVFYGLMHELATRRPLRRVRGGFIHVPWADGQGSPSMALDVMVAGIRAAVRCALATPADTVLPGGAEH